MRLRHVDGNARETRVSLTGGPSGLYRLQMLKADTMRLSTISKGSFFADESDPTFSTAP